jgi:hypothetical protein
MNIYRHWHRETVEIRIGGEPAKINVYGRSNVSDEDARANALERARWVERKIAGEELAREEYSVDIREEIVLEIDGHNIVTRNRYGARVLNTDSVVIIDVDHHRVTFLEALGFRKRDKKAAILEDLEKLARRPEYAQLGFRVYETAQGARVIVTGAYFDPASPQAAALFRESNADKTFAKLCVQQKCYRARLSPKPRRIQQPAFKYRWPMEGEELERAKEWVHEYEEKAQAFATCRFVKTLGREHLLPEVVSFHDEETGARSRLPLA